MRTERTRYVRLRVDLRDAPSKYQVWKEYDLAKNTMRAIIKDFLLILMADTVLTPDNATSVEIKTMADKNINYFVAWYLKDVYKADHYIISLPKDAISAMLRKVMTKYLVVVDPANKTSEYSKYRSVFRRLNDSFVDNNCSRSGKFYTDGRDIYYHAIMDSPYYIDFNEYELPYITRCAKCDAIHNMITKKEVYIPGVGKHKLLYTDCTKKLKLKELESLAYGWFTVKKYGDYRLIELTLLIYENIDSDGFIILRHNYSKFNRKGDRHPNEELLRYNEKVRQERLANRVSAPAIRPDSIPEPEGKPPYID